jgi:hypothetical protein
VVLTDKGGYIMAKTRTEIQAKYDAANRTAFGIRLHNENDAEIIAKLRSVPSINGYIRQLIRNDIEKEKGEKKMKTYTIKPEYVDLWGSEISNDTVITEDEVERLAEEWETPVDELLEQLIPID